MTLSLRTRLILLLVLLLAGTAGVLLLIQHQRRLDHDRQLAECGRLKQQLLSDRDRELRPRLARMRQLRLNDLQAQTLRQDDPNGYLRYAARYQESVNSVADSVEAFAAVVDRFEQQNCLRLLR